MGDPIENDIFPYVKFTREVENNEKLQTMIFENEKICFLAIVTFNK